MFSHAQEQNLTFLAEELPPYHFINNEGKVSGALVEIVQAMLKQANLRAKIEIQPFARGLKATQTQKNTFMFSMLKTPNRHNEFQWVGQTYKNSAVLIGLKNRKDIHLLSLDDAKKYVVGTIRGYHSDYYLRNYGFTEQENLSLSVTSKHMWPMLFNNRIDLVLTNYMALERDITQAGYNAEDISGYLTLPSFPSELHIATGLTTEKDLVEQLRTALSAIKQSGIYQDILNKYNL